MILKDKVFQSYYLQIILGLIAIPIGLIIGLVDAVFGEILLKITAFRDIHPYHLIIFLPLAGFVIAFCYKKYGGKSSKGMNLLFEVGHGEEEVIPLRLIPFVISGTWLTHLFGGSAGREGVAVQIGATFSHFIGRYIPIKNASQIFLIVGIAAGFSGLFQTPIAAVLFALEVLVASELRYDALFPTIVASIVSCFTSKFVGLEKFSFILTDSLKIDYIFLIKLIIIGIIFGIVGGLFAWSLKKIKDYFSIKFKNPLVKIVVIGVILSFLFLLFYKGRYSGLGTNLISFSFNDNQIFAWDWILKFILTVITLAAGFQGGEVTPLFSIGASLGVVLSTILGLPLHFTAALGYAAMFCGSTNTLLAPIFIGAEVFGFNYLPYFALVCAVTYSFNMNKSIYSLQKRKIFNYGK